MGMGMGMGTRSERIGWDGNELCGNMIRMGKMSVGWLRNLIPVQSSTVNTSASGDA